MNENSVRTFTIAAIFATLLATGVAVASERDPAGPFARPVIPGALHRLSGIVTSVAGDMLVVRIRNGRFVRVDATQAERELRCTQLFVTRHVMLYGRNASGVFEAWAIQRAREDPATWPADR